MATWCFDEKRDAMHTFLKALSMAGDGACVHMEDDIILTKNFLQKLTFEISQRPNVPIQFFSMRKDDLSVGSRWDTSFMMNQCFYLPEGMSKELRDWYVHWDKKYIHPTGSDIMVCDFLRIKKQKYWIHCPSLVQHRSERSLINPRRSTKRQSKTFIDPDV
jgi:GR25 family glycosyltransferase involved in LPS biosynthesis